MRQKQTLATMVLLVLVVFSLGVVVGNSWQNRGGEVEGVLRASELDAESFLVEQELFESFETNCQLAQERLRSQSGELGGLGKVLAADDARQKLGEEDYAFLKRKYHLLQIRTYVLEKKVQSDCGGIPNVVLYYYGKGDPLSREQGIILDELVDEQRFHVFAIELGYARELKFLEDYYGVEQAPTLVVNFKKVLPGLISKEEIMAAAKE
ncbi:hypothetical protein HY489_02065 [Candidatus Woesearchaeota archaeon]|nr:hypothetical protein [Candidatus Woesearchaeota archaeon]